MRRPVVYFFLCSILSMALIAAFHTEDYQFKNDFVDSLILIPNLKLAFCVIPKCGSTMITPILNYLSTYANTSCSVATWRWSSPECLGMDITNVSKIYHDSTWHKALFYRDPIVRFQSAFTSKCVPGHDLRGQSMKHCQRAFGGWNITIEHAMQQLNKSKTMHDIHFIPQSNYCGNLTKYIRYYDSKINLDISNREEMFRLFSRKGINATNAPKVFTLLDKAYPEANNTVKATPSTDPHITHASSHVKQLYAYAPYRDLLLNYYREDVLNFNITTPPAYV